MISAFLDFSILFDQEYFGLFLTGIKTTLLLCIIGNAISLVLGTVIGICKASSIKPLKYFAYAYVEVFRNTPLLVQVYFFYFGLGLEPFVSGLFGLCSYTSAYMAEVVRAGIQSVSENEIRSANALGLSNLNIIKTIILPQTFRIILPPMSNQLMNLTKNTAIVYFITVTDVTYIFETLSSQTFRYVEFFIVSALIYMIICWLIAIVSHWVEKRMYVPGITTLEVGYDH